MRGVRGEGATPTESLCKVCQRGVNGGGRERIGGITASSPLTLRREEEEVGTRWLFTFRFNTIHSDMYFIDRCRPYKEILYRLHRE